MIYRENVKHLWVMQLLPVLAKDFIDIIRQVFAVLSIDEEKNISAFTPVTPLAVIGQRS